MAKEILIYNELYSYTVSKFIQEMEDAQGQDIVVRANCPGGDVFSSYGVAAKWNEHTGNKTLKIDGRADSMMAFLLCNVNDAECLDVSRVMFHRAAYPSYIEDNKERFTEAIKKELTSVNTDLRKMMERKVNANMWQAITGVSLDAMFSLDTRIDVELDAQKCLALGLVKRVNSLTAERANEINAIAARFGIAAIHKVEAKITETIIKTHKIMTVAEFQAANPTGYKEILNAGAAQEKERIEAIMTFADADLKACTDMIASGATPGPKFFAEMSKKMMAKGTLGALKDENVENLDPNAKASEKPAEVLTAKQKEAAEIAKALKDARNIK